MKKNLFKKILIYTFSVFLLLVAVLALHIYLVYRPKAPNAFSRTMARIDIKEQISQDQANKITTWMTQQYGIDHVLVNPKTNIVVFTFFPVKTTGNQVVSNFKSNFHLKAERFMPSAEELKNGCPASSSYAFKIYKLITHII